MTPDPKGVVRRGYDAASYCYRGEDDVLSAVVGEWLEWVTAPVAPGRAVLDLGCGNGVPVARALAERYRVTGVDLSPVQVARAREFVPGGRFLCADMTEVDLPAGSFDAALCLYALIHVPLDEQAPVLGRLHGWLRPGARVVATVGQGEWTGTEPDWLGSGAPMWWSHADAQTYARWFGEAGFEVVGQEPVPDPLGGVHSLVRATRSPRRG